jgi:hypothetical protein
MRAQIPRSQLARVTLTVRRVHRQHFRVQIVGQGNDREQQEESGAERDSLEAQFAAEPAPAQAARGAEPPGRGGRDGQSEPERVEEGFQKTPCAKKCERTRENSPPGLRGQGAIEAPKRKLEHRAARGGPHGLEGRNHGGHLADHGEDEALVAVGKRRAVFFDLGKKTDLVVG